MTAARARGERFSMTPKARQMLAFIVGRHRVGRDWTYEQARQRLGYGSKGRPFELVSQLEERGYLRRDWRGRVCLTPAAFAAVPVVPVRTFTASLRPCEHGGSYPFRTHRTQAEIWAAEGQR